MIETYNCKCGASATLPKGVLVFWIENAHTGSGHGPATPGEAKGARRRQDSADAKRKRAKRRAAKTGETLPPYTETTEARNG